MARKSNFEAHDELYFGGLFASMALAIVERPEPACGRKPRKARRKAASIAEVAPQALPVTADIAMAQVSVSGAKSKARSEAVMEGVTPGFTTRQFDMFSWPAASEIAKPATDRPQAPEAANHQAGVPDRNRPYTDDDDKMIIRMMTDGASLYDIADILGRSRASVQRRKALIEERSGVQAAKKRVNAAEVKRKASSVHGASYLGLGQMVSDREMAAMYAGARYPQRSVPVGRLIVSSMSCGSSTPLVASQIGELVAANTKPKSKPQRQKAQGQKEHGVALAA